jgi:hypothetical protein
MGVQGSARSNCRSCHGSGERVFSLACAAASVAGAGLGLATQAERTPAAAAVCSRRASSGAQIQVTDSAGTEITSRSRATRLGPSTPRHPLALLLSLFGELPSRRRPASG